LVYTNFCVIVCFYFSSICLRVELRGHIIILSLAFWGTAKLFSQVAAPFFIPTRNVRGFQFLHVLANICYCILYDSYPSGFTVILICTSLMTNDVEHLFMCLLGICNLWRNVYSYPLFIFQLGYFLIIEFYNSLYNLVFWTQIPYQIYNLQIYSLILWLLSFSWYRLQHKGL